MLELLASLFLIVGGIFALVGSIGLARLPDLFMRLHGPTKATTLGVGGILIASMLHFSSLEAGFSLHELLVAVFLMITAPVSAHLIARTSPEPHVVMMFAGGFGAFLMTPAIGAVFMSASTIIVASIARPSHWTLPVAVAAGARKRRVLT